MRGGIPLGAVLVAIICSSVAGLGTVHGAQDEHNRRFAVELAVLAGDLRLLREDGLADAHRRGLEDRVSSTLGFIGLTGREALQASGRSDPDLGDDIRELRTSFAVGELTASSRILQRLMQRYLLDTRGFLPVDATTTRLTRGREIYRSMCRPCHIAPDTARPNPARDLFRDAAAMPAREFVARLLGGVRGVPETGLDNPFTDEDLRALLAWFNLEAATGKRTLGRRE